MHSWARPARWFFISVVAMATACKPREPGKATDPVGCTGTAEPTKQLAVEDGSTRLSNEPPARTPKDNPLAPNFAKYDLSEYVVVANQHHWGMHIDWGSWRFERRDDRETSRAQIVSRIRKGLANNGWQEGAALPRRRQPDPICPASPKEMHFHHYTRPDIDGNWWELQGIYVSEDAKTRRPCASIRNEPTASRRLSPFTSQAFCGGKRRNHSLRQKLSVRL